MEIDVFSKVEEAKLLLKQYFRASSRFPASIGLQG